MNKIRVGIIGFGVSARFFHAPFLSAHSGYEIVGVSTSQTDMVKSVLEFQIKSALISASNAPMRSAMTISISSFFTKQNE